MYPWIICPEDASYTRSSQILEKTVLKKTLVRKVFSLTYIYSMYGRTHPKMELRTKFHKR
jgi:hypothetical protein